ncbi:MAG: hypothetical protein ABIH67_01295 [Candidatus Uhrbacteria bacterium]
MNKINREERSNPGNKETAGFAFWKDWDNITEIETNAIEKIQLAKNKIINAVPKGQLVAIYIKGSFVRREMKEGSDIDIVPVVTKDCYQESVWETNTPEVLPAIVVPISVEEFVDNELHSETDLAVDLRAKPDSFLRMLDECELIYGQPLNLDNYPIRTDKETLVDEISVIRNGYIPYFESGQVDFDPLLKETFWLIELVQTVNGKRPKYSFEGIAASVDDNDHIVHDALGLRMMGSKKQRSDFVVKLKEYLNEIERQISSN